MLDLVGRPLGGAGWTEAVTRSSRPEQKRLEVLLLDPGAGWSVERLDLRYPGAAAAIDSGEFVVSEIGDIDGDGHPEIVLAVTPTGAPPYLLAYRCDRGRWQAEPIQRNIESVDFIRSVALGDLDGDGCDEIVIGTRPDGAIVLFERRPSGYTAALIDTQQQGANNSNIREVAIGDIGNTGQLDVFAASARANEPVKWDRVPGAIFRYRRTGGRWERLVIEDHGGQTHTRMLRVGKVRGLEQVVSCAVGVHDTQHQRIDPEPVLQMHRLAPDGTVERETIAVLEKAIKSRSLAIGDIDGDGANELVVGTRSLGFGDYGATFLYLFKYDATAGAWSRQTLDTSEPLGFHCVTLADLDGEGRPVVIASDDGKGLVKAYRFRDGAWQAEVILSRPNFIFVNAMGMVDCS